MRTIREEERPTLLLMAAGAVAGAAAGLYLGRRYRSMDAFLEDMRDRFGALRDIWYDDELSLSRRERLGINVVDDEIDEEENEEENEEEDEEELDELDEDELAAAPFATSESYEEDEEDLDEDEADEFEDEFDDEIEAVGRDNGVSEAAQRAEDMAERLEARVLEELRNEPVLSTRSIEIAVVGDGVVELTGTVHAIDEISRAAAVVRGVPGVSMVLNRIEVRTGGSIDTASVARDPASPSE